MKARYYFCIIVFLGLFLCIGQHIYASENIKIDTFSISELSFLDKIGIVEKNIDERIDLSGSNTNIIGNFADFKNIKIAWWSMWIAVSSCFLTFFIFLIQLFINWRQGNDVKKERLENRYNLLLNQYESRVRNFEILNIGQGNKVFNFLFYEYKMLFQLFSEMGFNIKGTLNPISDADLSSIAVSFVLNGITSDNDGSCNDIIYSKYSEILSLEDYQKMKNKIIYYRENLSSVDIIKEPEKVDELKILAERYTLFANFARYVLMGDTIYWFYGVRFYFLPIVKSLRNIAEFIEKNSVNFDTFIEKYNLIQITESMLTNSELGFLYAFVRSRENERICLSESFVKKIVEISDLPNIYICYED